MTCPSEWGKINKQFWNKKLEMLYCDMWLFEPFFRRYNRVLLDMGGALDIQH